VKGTVDRPVWSDSADWSPNSKSVYYKDPTKGAVMRVGRGRESGAHSGTERPGSECVVLRISTNGGEWIAADR